MTPELARAVAPFAFVLAGAAWTWASTRRMPTGPVAPRVPRGAWVVALPLLAVLAATWASGVVSSDEITELRGADPWLRWWTADAGLPSRMHRLVRSLVGGDQAIAPTRLLNAALGLAAAAVVARTARDASGGRGWRWVGLLVFATYATLWPFSTARARALALLAQLVAVGGFQDALAGRQRAGARALGLGLLVATLDDPTSGAGLVPAAAWLAWYQPALRAPLAGAVALAGAAAGWPAIEALVYHRDAGSTTQPWAWSPIRWGLAHVAVLAALVAVGRWRGLPRQDAVEAHALAAGAGMLALVVGVVAGVLPAEGKAIFALEPWATLAVALLVVHVLDGLAATAARTALTLVLLLPSFVELVAWPLWVGTTARTLAATAPAELTASGSLLVGPEYHAATWMGALGDPPTSPRIGDWALGPYAPLGPEGRQPCVGAARGVVWMREVAGPPLPPIADPACTCAPEGEAGPWVLLRCGRGGP